MIKHLMICRPSNPNKTTCTMKNNTLNSKKSFLLVPLFLGAVLSAQTTVVQWGSDDDIVDGFTIVNRNSISASTTTPFSPSGGTNDYYGGESLTPSGRSAVFYGSLYNAEASQSRYRVFPAAPDPLNFQFNGTANDHTHAGLIFWQQADGFLNGFDSATLDYSDVEFDLTVVVATARDEQSVHLIVREGASTFYASNRLGNLLSGVDATFTEADVTSWSAYDPTSDIVTIGAAATPTLSDVTAIGYLFTSFDSDRTLTDIRMNEFVVTAVPELGSFGLIGGIFVLSMVLVRRKRY